MKNQKISHYNWLGKTMYHLGMINAEKDKVRFLHPLGLIANIIFFIIIFFMEGIKGVKENYPDMVCLW